MARCNSCGRNVQPTENMYKRQIYNGHASRTNYGGKRISFSSSNFYSMKFVCTECANEIDAQQEQKSKSGLIIIGIIVALVILFFALR